ncbi:hypothetical protein SAMN05421854_104314 [Amycolatopsis rubida]|uniref:Uncharacterized protein n=1 Tax=Amycolatopsis rubida TaxID=112413 RepID=A0A1I5NA04_9PSEU|nr:hypothetical protein SAMN05421854_104314 [Amycolatopsis rubida]
MIRIREVSVSLPLSSARSASPARESGRAVQAIRRLRSSARARLRQVGFRSGASLSADSGGGARSAGSASADASSAVRGRARSGSALSLRLRCLRRESNIPSADVSASADGILPDAVSRSGPDVPWRPDPAPRSRSLLSRVRQIRELPLAKAVLEAVRLWRARSRAAAECGRHLAAQAVRQLATFQDRLRDRWTPVWSRVEKSVVRIHAVPCLLRQIPRWGSMLRHLVWLPQLGDRLAPEQNPTMLCSLVDRMGVRQLGRRRSVRCGQAKHRPHPAGRLSCLFRRRGTECSSQQACRARPRWSGPSFRHARSTLLRPLQFETSEQCRQGCQRRAQRGPPSCSERASRRLPRQCGRLRPDRWPDEASPPGNQVR